MHPTQSRTPHADTPTPYPPASGLPPRQPPRRWPAGLGWVLALLLWAGPLHAQECTATSTAITGTGQSGDLTGLVEDCNTLLSIKDSLAGGKTSNLNWDKNTSMSQWAGVSIISGDPPRVTMMVLHSALGQNNTPLDGTIPAGFGNLTGLTQVLIEGDLKLSAALSFHKMTSLTVLDLSNCPLGRPPRGLGNLPALTTLKLAGTGLSSLPSVPTSLTELHFSNNNLRGSLSASLGNLTSLTLLYLARNQLTSIASVPWGNLKSLRILDLERNNLGGDLPASLGGLSALESLSLQKNKLTGLQAGFADPDDLPSLEILWLQNNELTGEFPRELVNLRKLEELRLDHNQLTSLPELAWDNMAELTDLRLDNNQLSGRIPRSLGLLKKVQHLHLNYNPDLTGEIPLWWGGAQQDHDDDPSTPNVNSLRQLATFEIQGTNWTGQQNDATSFPKRLVDKWDNENGTLRLQTNRRPRAPRLPQSLVVLGDSFGFAFPAFTDPEGEDLHYRFTANVFDDSHAEAKYHDWADLPTGWEFDKDGEGRPYLIGRGVLEPGESIKIRLEANDVIRPYTPLAPDLPPLAYCQTAVPHNDETFKPILCEAVTLTISRPRF